MDLPTLPTPTASVQPLSPSPCLSASFRNAGWPSSFSSQTPCRQDHPFASPGRLLGSAPCCSWSSHRPFCSPHSAIPRAGPEGLRAGHPTENLPVPPSPLACLTLYLGKTAENCVDRTHFQRKPEHVEEGELPPGGMGLRFCSRAWQLPGGLALCLCILVAIVGIRRSTYSVHCGRRIPEA